MADIKEAAKSFWSRPEGKTGMLMLAGIGGGLLYFWGIIVPFLVSMMASTLHLVVLCVAVALLLTVIFSPKTHLLFRLLSRAITGLFISIDPIGILKDRLSQMRKRRDEMVEQTQTVRGSIGSLKQEMLKNQKKSEDLGKQAQYAQRKAEESKDEEERLRMHAQAKISGNESVRATRSNERYMELLVKLERIYKMLTTLGVSIDTYIQDTQNEVRQQEHEYKTINSAYKAFKSAMRVLKGNGAEEDIYNSTLEHLADEAGRKLGEMEDMQRLAQTFMDKIDVENGAIEEDALKMLSAYEQKMLPAAAPKITIMQKTPTGDAEYARLFRKEK